VVSDGAEALDYLRPDDGEHPPADGYPKLVLLDLKLPRVGGIEVLRRLKASERTRLIPVVVMTSSREEIDLVASYKYGANSYIVKPVDFEQFMKAVGVLGLYWMLFNEVPR
jgi:two-component system response regulator